MNRDPVDVPRRSVSEFIADEFPRALFWLSWSLAGGLLALVFLCPMLDNPQEAADGWRRPLAIFARDGAMRRTAVGSAVGLVVTACVFFRSPRLPRPPRPSRSSAGPIVGA